MKAIRDKSLTLKKRIELYVYMAEESDWQPLREFIKRNELPQINITIDANYPAVTAEKGFGTLSMTFPNLSLEKKHLQLVNFSGGFFGSQIPEDAKVKIVNANEALTKLIKKRSAFHEGMTYSYTWEENNLTIAALGKSAHSSNPQHGINAITHLSDLLSFKRWPNNSSGSLVNFLNDNFSTGLYGEKFGSIAYQDDFMGRMTVSPTVLKTLKDGIQLSINLRRPRGKTKGQLEKEIQNQLDRWQKENDVTIKNYTQFIGEPFVQTGAPHLDTLLNVFSHYTGIKNAKPVSIGGGTNSRLFPNAISFGPSMPGTEYTGHSEHEYITMDQFVLNLKMYTAVLVELTK